MDNLEASKTLSLEGGPEYCFWESEVYLKARSCRFFKDHLFKYLDHGPKLYIFFTWARRWITLVSKQYVEPYKFYPLPVSDQIMYWQPIFSKRVSDGLVSLDKHVTSGSPKKKKTKSYKSVMLRALFSTFWKRILFIMLCFFVLNTSTMCLVFIVKRIIHLLFDEPDRYFFLYSFIFLLAFLQFIIAILMDHANFYMYRLIHVIQYLFSITIFQNGLCHRRRFANNINGSNQLNVCNRVLHSCSPDSECSKNPLFCQALRYQNKDINSRIFAFEFMDSYYISLFIESVIYILQFMFNFIAGFWVVKHCIPIRVWPLYVFYLSVTFLMGLVEVFNTLILKYIYGLKDYRINKSREIISALNLIDKMCMDDIAHNIITSTRNNELMLLFLRFLLSFLNRLFVNILTSFSVYHVLDDLVKETIKTQDLKKFETAPMVATMTVMLKISDSMLFVPDAMKFFTYSLMSYLRAEYYMNDCSPNFYISGNKFTGSTQTSNVVTEVTNEIPNDVVVYYKDATFTWVNTRHDLLNKNYEPLLKNINFELKRGEMAIVTGSKGSGKSNFIKSMLGEMTLVGGSMAVVPLHTSMPIFYASQDIFLQQGTIRSNIVFGYKFDEQIYNTVLKAAELEYDVSTWEKGDLRVVSDNAHSLSGGQRVRMELARAVYAYLVFHKVNKEYNNSQCSFLMCLDDSFHGLDPYVSKTIFNNLFNLKTGLLAKDDLSVVLCSTKSELIGLSSADVPFLNMTLYNIANKNVNKIKDIRHPETTRKTLSSQIQAISTYEIMKLCDSGENSREGRIAMVTKKYEDSLIISPESKVTKQKIGLAFKPYFMYAKSIGFLFVLFIIFTIAYESIETSKYVLAGDLGGEILRTSIKTSDPKQYIESFQKIRKMCDDTLLKIKKLTMALLVFCFFANFVLTFCCLRGCKRIHEYCINSLINNKSSVVRIKKYSSEIVTFLASDVFIIDENFGPCLSTMLILFIEVLLQTLILAYYFPICIPFVVICIFVIINFVFKKFVHASKNLQIASLESLSRNNSVCQNAVSSSSTYRSFKKESTLLDNVIEYTDYCIRSWFYSKSFLSWASFVSKFIFFIMTLSSFVIPMIYKELVKVKDFVGVYGFNILQNLRIMFTFTNFVVTIAKLEMLMCSIKRFECFIPPGQKCKFQKYRNVYNEELVLNVKSYRGSDSTETEVTKSLVSRRRKEFKDDNRKFYFVRRLFHHPKISILDVGRYLTPEHTGVELRDVCVYTTPELTPESMILKHVSVTAYRSEIIGMVGRTGAGKTTLLSVLQNVVENRTGQVLLDGKDLNDIPKVVLRQIIGVLPQLPFVFKGWTVRRFLDPRKLFSDEEINQALNECGLLEFVNDIPGGKKLDTIIIQDNLNLYMPTKKNITQLNTENLKEYYEECDMLLSNTQLRTLSLARLVLYKKLYRVILVDEPPENAEENENSGFDSDRKAIGVPIYELLKTHFQHCTTFVTAHDSNALRMCNSIWILHHGTFMGKCGTEDILKENSIANIVQKFVK
ncbi:hypothetical protein MACJ_002824 [Theileria orientalis]|uniref:ABC transporter n=1 Tax=Theileria orientalis TaxID=68886 RepID=A0A976M6M3_THEOR|nr:hypothetical protein MACJ_002824 [Theileria orientalis]